MKKLVVIIILVCAVVGGRIFYWKKEQAKKETEAPEMTSVKVEHGSISMIVASTERIVSSLDVDINCKTSGEVIYDLV